MTETRSIGRFTNAEIIGRGGFGAVYRATDVEHQRQVAIKVLPGALGEAERRRFDRERQTMGRLGAHPNIVPVHESGYTEAGEGYIVMELAEGGSLADKLATSGPLPWADAVRIMASVANAAQAAHDEGVLHRDIKPDNILIDHYGHPKLSDFGIAAVANNATATTSTTATIAHAAPEVLQGHKSTPAIDIYAVGSTLFNLITGLPPFLQSHDEGVTPMITRALTEPPPDLRRQGVPDGVADVIERALAKEPAGRQATAAQLANELTAAASGATAPAATGPEPHAANTVVAQAPVANPSPPVGQPPRFDTPGQGPGPYNPSPQPSGAPAAAPGYGAAPPGYQRSGAPAAAVPGYGAAPPPGYQSGPPLANHYQHSPNPNLPTDSWTPGVPPPSSSGSGSNRAALWIVGAILAFGLIAVGTLIAVNRGNDADTATGPDDTLTLTPTVDDSTTSSSTSTTSTTEAVPEARSLIGQVNSPFGHSVEISIEPNGTITGRASWSGGVAFDLAGNTTADGVFFEDDADEVNPNNDKGFYEGTWVSDTRIEGNYYEDDDPLDVAPFTITVIG